MSKCCDNTGGVVFDDPLGFIGLTTVDGVATTAMRSDGHPPLSQAIAPNWTSEHVFQGRIVYRANPSLRSTPSGPYGSGVFASQAGVGTYNTGNLAGAFQSSKQTHDFEIGGVYSGAGARTQIIAVNGVGNNLLFDTGAGVYTNHYLIRGSMMQFNTDLYAIFGFTGNDVTTNQKAQYIRIANFFGNVATTFILSFGGAFPNSLVHFVRCNWSNNAPTP